MQIVKSTKLIAWVASTLLGFFSILIPAQAGSATTTVPVNVSVSQVCTIATTTGLSFASYDPVTINASAALNAVGLITITCSKGSSGVSVGMGYGAHASGVTQRQMIGSVPANLIQYNVFQPPSTAAGTACTFPATIPWTNVTGVGLGMLTVTAAPDNTARTYYICGTIPGGQNASADAYTDSIVATINF